MTRQISEADWKVFRQLRAIALERLCQRVLSEIENVASQPNKSAYDRYLQIFKVIKQRDDEIARWFDELRRSTAMLQLIGIRSLGLLTPEELARFSPEMQNALESI